MRIGIFGGTFDPVHVGHLIIAESAREQLGLDQVRWIPAAIAPHQQLKQSTAGEHRRNMVQLAINGNPSFICDDRELRRGGKSYTVETLGELNSEVPEADWFFLMGADSLREFANWKHPEQICKLARIVVVARGGQPEPNLQQLNRFLATAKSDEQLQEDHLLRMPQLEISSTDLRQRTLEQRSIRYQVPASVEVYIAQNNLYKSN